MTVKAEAGRTAFAQVRHVAPEVDSASGMIVAEADLTVGQEAPGSLAVGSVVRVSP